LKQDDIHPYVISDKEDKYFNELIEILRKSNQRADDIFAKSLDDLVKQ
jgi:hypothetical protein